VVELQGSLESERIEHAATKNQLARKQELHAEVCDLAHEGIVRETVAANELLAAKLDNAVLTSQLDIEKFEHSETKAVFETENTERRAVEFSLAQEAVEHSQTKVNLEEKDVALREARPNW
jgi:hypothetical protein